MPVNVKWINDLVDDAGDPLPHLLGPSSTRPALGQLGADAVC